MRRLITVCMLFTYLQLADAEARWSSKVHAWIYPSSVTCSAKQEVQSRGYFAIRAEYFMTNGDGSLLQVNEVGTSTCNGYSAANAAILRANSVEQYITWSAGASAMIEFFSNSKQVTQSINTVVDLVVTAQFTGVDIDFEGYDSWSASDYSNFKSFATQLGNALHSKGKKLALDGPPIDSAKSQSWYKWTYSDFLNLPVDSLVVMAYDYDYDDGVGSPIQPTKWLGDVIDYTISQVNDLNKIVIGIPSYGYYGPRGTYDINRINKEQATAMSGYSSATRDSASYEMSFTSGGKWVDYQDSNGLNSKRAFIEGKGILHVSVFHLGKNDWFTGKLEPIGGYVGSPSNPPPASPTPDSPTPAPDSPTPAPDSPTPSPKPTRSPSPSPSPTPTPSPDSNLPCCCGGSSLMSDAGSLYRESSLKVKLPGTKRSTTKTTLALLMGGIVAVGFVSIFAGVAAGITSAKRWKKLQAPLVLNSMDSDLSDSSPNM